MQPDAAAPLSRPHITDLTRVFLRIGVLSFGGPAAQIALMHRELVDERPWLTERQFLNALSFCMLLPGPEAMQLATYCGWKLHGVRGGLIAGGLFVLPGAAIMLGLSLIYAYFGSVPVVAALFTGVKAAVVVIVIEALFKLARRALNLPDHWVIAALSFVAIFVFDLPFPFIILAAALWGALRALPAPASAASVLHPHRDTLRTVVLWLALWFAPLAVLWALGQTFLVQIGLFFSQLAVVTFGGAYAVLAYMTQAVVQDFGWITTEAMMDGLGLAETTPGPLILVTQFVGFLAGFGAGGLGLAIAAALLTLWTTFVPCFLWIFAGAPYIDWISSRPRLRGALAGITAAVVGVILNLSIWFAAHVFFDRVDTIDAGPVRMIVPDPATLNLAVLGLALIAGLLLVRLRWPLVAVLAVSALGGLLIGGMA